MRKLASVAVMVAALGAPARTVDAAARDTPAQAPVPDACTLLTLPELTAAAGVNVIRPRPSMAPNGTQCRYRAGLEPLNISIGRTTAREFAEFRTLLIDQGKSVEAVSGLGSQAYWWDDRVYVLLGDLSYSVDLGTSTTAPLTEKHRAAALAVAKALAPKLK